jgi:peptidoglycan hydrolase CwlO-like protein
MRKTIIWTIIIYSILIFLVGYIYYNHKNNQFNTEIENINNRYQNKYDSLNNNINTYKIKIKYLDSLISMNDNQIDSIKNKQKDYEKPIFTSFRNISTDSIVSLFSGYNK